MAVRAGRGTLVEYLDQVVDDRSRQDLRYELGFLLAVVVAATACAGHDEVAAQAQWAADAPGWVLAALGAEPDPLTGTITAPSEATLRRALARVDAADLQRLTAQWVGATVGATRTCDDGGGRRLVHHEPTSVGRCRACRRVSWRGLCGRRFPCVVWRQIRGELLGHLTISGYHRHRANSSKNVR